MSRAKLSPRQRGFALLIVLWTMALLALIGTQVTSAGHGETKLAANLRASAVAQAAADGAVFEAVLHLLDGSRDHWYADGIARRIKMPQAVVDVEMVDEGRKMTLNNSSLPMVRGVMRAAGVNDNLSAILTDQIADWRSPSQVPLPKGAKGPQYLAAGREYGPPNQPFRTVEEMQMLLAMTAEVYARINPYFSPYVESSPKAMGADPVIARALADAQVAGAPTLAFEEAATVTVTALAVANGVRFIRRAVIRLATDQLTSPGAPLFMVLEWNTAGD